VTKPAGGGSAGTTGGSAGTTGSSRVSSPVDLTGCSTGGMGIVVLDTGMPGTVSVSVSVSRLVVSSALTATYCAARDRGRPS